MLANTFGSVINIKDGPACKLSAASVEKAKTAGITIKPAKIAGMDPRTEALLYAASRRQHLKDRVLPALKNKSIVLCDRFVDSSLAYQGYARDLGMQEVYDINQFAIDGCMPIKTFFLSVSIETGQKRMDLRGDKNRLDLEQSDFHKKVREGYAKLIVMYPERICVIDAEPELKVVVKNALNEVMKVIHEYE